MVNASDLKSDEQKMFLSVRSRSGVQIIKSPSERSCGERFRFYVLSVLLQSGRPYRYAYRESLKRSKEWKNYTTVPVKDGFFHFKKEAI